MYGFFLSCVGMTKQNKLVSHMNIDLKHLRAQWRVLTRIDRPKDRSNRTLE